MTTSSIEHLAESLTLVDIRFFEIHGQVDLPRADADGPDGPDLQLGIEIGERADERGLIAILTSTWTQGPVRLHVVVGGLYDVSAEDIEYGEDLLQEFADRVGMFQLLPFAREGIASLATRLRITPPLIPLMHQLDGNPSDLARESDEGGREGQPA